MYRIKERSSHLEDSELMEEMEFDTSLEVVVIMPGLMPMQTGAPPNTGDPAFGEDIGFSTLVNALDGDTAATKEPVATDEYDDVGPQDPDGEE